MARYPPRKQSGAILVLSLWLIVVLSMMAYSLTHELRIGLRMTSQAKRKLQATAIARAGMAQAVNDLKNQRLLNASLNSYANTLEDVWNDQDEQTNIKFGEGEYTIRIVDENSKMDVNMLNPKSVGVIQFLLEEFTRHDDEDIQNISYAIVDYIDGDMEATTALESIDEIENYTEWGLKSRLASEMGIDWIFRPKNDTLILIDELLEIPGITRKLLYGDPEGMAMDPIERFDSVEDSKALVDYLTVRNGNRMNINTCPVLLLEAILTSMDPQGPGYSSLAEEIEDYREEKLVFEEDGTQGIVRLNDLAEIGVPEGIISELQQTFQMGWNSHYFTIISRGTFEGIQKTMFARVNVQMEQYNFDPDDETTYGFRDLKSAGFLENRPNLKIDPSVRVEYMWEL
jgi:hypothetical protein